MCEDAVRLTDRISDFEALNRDVGLDNILVRQSILSLFRESSAPPLHEYIGKTCVAIDLTHMEFRREDVDDLDWMDKKLGWGEAFGIGTDCEREIRDTYLGPKDLEGDKPCRRGIWRYKETSRFMVPKNEEDAENIKKSIERYGLGPWIGPH